MSLPGAPMYPREQIKAATVSAGANALLLEENSGQIEAGVYCSLFGSGSQAGVEFTYVPPPNKVETFPQNKAGILCEGNFNCL